MKSGLRCAIFLIALCLVSACGDDSDPGAQDGAQPQPDVGMEVDVVDDVQGPQDADDGLQDVEMTPDAPDLSEPEDIGKPDVGEPPDAQDDVEFVDVDEDAPSMDDVADASMEDVPDEEPDVEEPTPHLNIDILGALIGPGKSDRTQWDGFGDVPEELWLTVAILVEMPVNDVLDFLSRAAVQSLAKPDPFGTVELDLGDGWEQPMELANRSNTFQPLFDDAIYTNIPVETQLRMKVELWDEDVNFDDPIGAVIISKDDILAARDAGGSYWVNVASQSIGQIIFVQIAVAEFDP